MNWKRFLGLGILLITIFTVTQLPAHAQDDATTSFANTDIVIKEVAFNGDATTDRIRLENTGVTTIDVSSWRLCVRPYYPRLDTLPLRPGHDLVLSPGEIVDIKTNRDLGNTTGEVALYIDGSFGSTSSIVDYVQWGTGAPWGGSSRESVAVGAGMWTTDDYVDLNNFPLATQSIQFDGANGGGGLLTLSTDFTVASPTAVSFQSTGLGLNDYLVGTLLTVILLGFVTIFVWRQNKIAGIENN